MAITRRQFLKRTCLAASGVYLGPGLFANPFVRHALADTIGDRYLVVLFLDGGNDGLNTVVPYDNVGGLRTVYENARDSGSGGLRLALSALSVPSRPFVDPNSGTQLGFHPGLGGLRDLYDLVDVYSGGKVAVIQGCGYPQYSLSHEESRVIWQTGNPLGSGPFAGSGWMGRYLAANYGADEVPAVNIADSISGEYKTTATSVLAIRRLEEFGFPYDLLDIALSDQAFKREAFESLYQAASGATHPGLNYIGNGGLATLISSESYPPLHGAYVADRPSWDQDYADLDTGTARRLREVAKIIYGVSNGAANVNARFFQLSNGGYDTHSDQGGAATTAQHYVLHKEVGDAIKLFYEDCADMGVANKVCILVWSEFSRRIQQNDNGTDHGSQGPVFVIGGEVNGGVYGNHPDIATAYNEGQAGTGDGNTHYTQDDNNQFRSTDLRDVYGTVLKRWLNMPHDTIKTAVLPLDTGPAPYYWTDEDFDLGFLPPPPP